LAVSFQHPSEYFPAEVVKNAHMHPVGGYAGSQLHIQIIAKRKWVNPDAMAGRVERDATGFVQHGIGIVKAAPLAHAYKVPAFFRSHVRGAGGARDRVAVYKPLIAGGSGRAK